MNRVQNQVLSHSSGRSNLVFQNNINMFNNNNIKNNTHHQSYQNLVTTIIVKFHHYQPHLRSHHKSLGLHHPGLPSCLQWSPEPALFARLPGPDPSAGGLTDPPALLGPRLLHLGVSCLLSWRGSRWRLDSRNPDPGPNPIIVRILRSCLGGLFQAGGRSRRSVIHQCLRRSRRTSRRPDPWMMPSGQGSDSFEGDYCLPIGFNCKLWNILRLLQLLLHKFYKLRW